MHLYGIRICLKVTQIPIPKKVAIWVNFTFWRHPKSVNISHLTPHSHGLFVMVFNRNRLIPASIQKMILHKVFASSRISTLVIAGDMCIYIIYILYTCFGDRMKGTNCRTSQYLRVTCICSV